MKKFLAMILAGVLALSLAACGKSDKTSAGSSESDLEYVKNKGTLVVGITDFAPMDYKDDNGNWIGFDADMAAAFAESLGVKVEFVEITWDNKLMELKGKTIDCVWNGMTLTEDVVSAMECTKPYCNNQQIVIVKKENADKRSFPYTIDIFKILSKTCDYIEEQSGDLNNKKNKKILFFCVIFADLIRIVYVMKVCEAEIRHFILRISVRIKGSEQNVIYLCTDRQRIIKISANF